MCALKREQARREWESELRHVNSPHSVGGHLAVDAARIVLDLADERRQRVRRPGTEVHGGDRAPRLRVVVRHDDDDVL